VHIRQIATGKGYTMSACPSNGYW